MSKKVKVLVSVLLAVVLLTVGGAATVMADEEPAPALQAEAKGLLARVAGILGVPHEDLVNAFRQARQEIREECQATENCTISQEKVSRFRERWTEKWQEWTGKRQQWMEKKQEMSQRFQGNGTGNKQNKHARISQAVRGRQMIAVPKGWDGSISPEPVY
ncbi:hypothetical protein ACFLVA_00965 [Chloroflexota bacterium]